MSTGTDDQGEPLAPDEAFAALGNETRMAILRTLGDADGALTFSELRDRVGMADSGQFNYHLGKLDDHFVRDTGDGYTLQRAGERVVEAVLSGAVTDAPVVEPTETDDACPYCGAPTAVSYRQGILARSCTECAGAVASDVDTASAVPDALADGYINSYYLPPAGVEGRAVSEALDAAGTWSGFKILEVIQDVCPRCSAPVEQSVEVCETHDSTDEVCGDCGYRYAAMSRANCTNCIFDALFMTGINAFTDPGFVEFLASNGLNPTSMSGELDRVIGNHVEEVISADPFEARYTFKVEGEACTLTLDNDYAVADLTVHDAGSE